MVGACRGARLRVHRDHRPLAAFGGVAHTLTAESVKRQAEEIAGAARAVSPTSRSCTDAKWTSCRTAGSISPTGSSSSSTSCSRRCTIGRAGARSAAAPLRRARCGTRSSRSSRIRPTGSCRTARLRPRLRPAFEAAAETGTWLEIDGAPAHLDMDGALARRAIAAGVTVAVDSDCHRAELLARQMDLGIDHRAPRLGRAAARAEHASARGRPRALIARKRAG